MLTDTNFAIDSQSIYKLCLSHTVQGQTRLDIEIIKYALSTINGMEVSNYIEQGVDVI